MGWHRLNVPTVLLDYVPLRRAFSINACSLAEIRSTLARPVPSVPSVPYRWFQAAGYARSVLLKYSPYVFPWLWRDPVMTGDFDISDSEILLANVFLRYA